MTLEDTLYDLLSGTAAITTLVSDRIYEMRRDQGSGLPALVYWRVSGPRVHSHDGASGLAHPRFQVDCWATTPSGANALAEAVRTAVDAYSTGDIKVAFLVNEQAAYEDETGEFFKILDFMFWHGEA